MWIDQVAQRQVIKLRDEFGIKEYVETGTFKGINAEFESQFFDKITTVESNADYYLPTSRRLRKLNRNINPYFDQSDIFLKKFRSEYKFSGRKDNVLFFLDAHFYNPEAKTQKERWVVLGELEALKDFNNGIVMIHDFDVNGLGHLVYDNEHLNFDLVRNRLLNINPNFYFYGNREDQCKITVESELPILGITDIQTAIENLRYAWSKWEKTYRGILYATPKPLDLNKYQLIEIKDDDCAGNYEH